MKFYRYETNQNASTDHNGEYVSSKFINPYLVLREYNLFQETPKGYWIGYGDPDSMHSGKRWVSKTARKRYAYPTKNEALDNLIFRKKKQIKIVQYILDRAKADLALGLEEQKKRIQL